MHVVPISVPQLGNRCHLVHDGVSGLVVDAPRDVTRRGERRRGPGREHRGGGGDPPAQRLRLGRTVARPTPPRGLPDQRRGARRRRARRGARRRRGPGRQPARRRARHPRSHPAPPGVPRLRVAPRNAGRALQRRQPAPRHGRSHRPRRPAAVASPGAGPVGVGPPARQPWAPRPPCTRPTASAASAPGPRQRPTAERRSAHSGSSTPRCARSATPSSTGCVATGSGRCRRTTAGWHRSTGPAQARPLRSPRARSPQWRPRRCSGWAAGSSTYAAPRTTWPVRCRARSASRTATSSPPGWGGWCPGVPRWCWWRGRSPTSTLPCATCTASASRTSAPTCSARPCRPPAACTGG